MPLNVSKGFKSIRTEVPTAKEARNTARLCPYLCAPVPTNVSDPQTAQTVLHPRKDVFVLKVAKVGPKGDRRCKMELELVTPKYQDKRLPYRVDTRETQCDPDPPPCCDCCTKSKKKRT